MQKPYSAIPMAEHHAIQFAKTLLTMETLTMPNYIIGNTVGYCLSEGLYMCGMCKPRREWSEDYTKALKFDLETAQRIARHMNCVQIFRVD